MDYSLKSDETVTAGIRRIHTGVLKETRSLLRTAGPDRNIHEIVHNTLKSINFLTALLRLIKPVLGAERFEREKHSISSHGGRISKLRDIHLLIVILQHVASQAHGVRRVDIDDGLRQLREREKELIDTAVHQDNIFRRTESRMLSAENRVDEWPEFPDSIDPLMPGLEEVYADGRACYRQARENPGDSDLHAWAQQVNHLMHLFEILAIFWPGELGINGPSLHQLSGYLGEEHDLALFKKSLKAELWTNKLKNSEALISYTDQKRVFLRRSALNLGGFVYKLPVDAFVAVFRERARAE